MHRRVRFGRMPLIFCNCYLLYESRREERRACQMCRCYVIWPKPVKPDQKRTGFPIPSGPVALADRDVRPSTVNITRYFNITPLNILINREECQSSTIDAPLNVYLNMNSLSTSKNEHTALVHISR